MSYKKLQILTNRRYLCRSLKYRKNNGECPYDKDFVDSEDLSQMNDDEFLQTYCISRKNIKKLINLCKYHPLFKFLNRNKTINKEKN